MHSPVPRPFLHPETTARAIWKRELRTRDPTGPQGQTCTSRKSVAAARTHAPHTRWKSGLPTPPHATDLSIPRALPTALAHQRPQSAEAAKHRHGGTRFKARRPSRAPRPLDPPSWGVSGGPRPEEAAACPSASGFRLSGHCTSRVSEFFC